MLLYQLFSLTLLGCVFRTDVSSANTTVFDVIVVNQESTKHSAPVMFAGLASKIVELFAPVKNLSFLSYFLIDY